ncbi:response regulator transcription factor [Armatimonas rosea]|uniref:Two-component system KDP operon response regulator KdpE n=1 Tax=Armatimonas rosea TaxID=685828 RepID=A0A7W9SKS5_ARMRO|nr:response regulator transcription factor [Armatimonas rosea]MBB6048446.1 two-component system KDP operon response regulator KdpE [Armatimonas rosea]
MSAGVVLVIEDDPHLQQVLADQLRQQDWTVSTSATGQGGLDSFAKVSPDIVLLDIGLGDMNGLQVCQALRQQSTVPIILVTAADTPQMKITALELGADDYLTKPFYLGELLARMRAVLRRTQKGQKVSPNAVIEIGPLRIDLNKREVFREDVYINLTKTEFDILQALVKNIDEAISYKNLLKQVWGEGYDDIRSLHVHLSHLRKKIEPDVSGPRYLVTIPGMGYRLRSQLISS